MALEEARAAAEEGEVPVGAVLVKMARSSPVPITAGRPRATPWTTRRSWPCWRDPPTWAAGGLKGSTIYVTLEPCPMCAGALVQARVARLVFGARDLNLGAAGSRYNLVSDETAHHRMEITDGILEEECRTLLQDFFEARRNGKKPSVDRFISFEPPHWTGHP